MKLNEIKRMLTGNFFSFLKFRYKTLAFIEFFSKKACLIQRT
jgi:hypothetical protein